MPLIPLQYLFRPTSTPEQEIFLNAVYNTYKIKNVEPLYYMGLLAGTEFLTYAATKLYFGYSVQVNNATAHGETEGTLVFYNAANAAFYNAKNQTAYWEVVGAKDEFCINPIDLKNVWFSRVTVAIYDSIIFNGYRITI
jgi:hypothetical protein